MCTADKAAAQPDRICRRVRPPVILGVSISLGVPFRGDLVAAAALHSEAGNTRQRRLWTRTGDDGLRFGPAWGAEGDDLTRNAGAAQNNTGAAQNKSGGGDLPGYTAR
jgi:hypothetical protein